MTIDVIIPTHNREPLLARALNSIRAAQIPDGLEVRVLVVDNGSTDGTARLVCQEAAHFGGTLHYRFVGEPGKAYALNSGIAATAGDLVGLIDDDEEIDRGWFSCIYSAFTRNDIDFIGGKCLPRWEVPAPTWLTHGYLGVIGWVDAGDVVRPLDRTYPGILMGGNAVLRREILDRAGAYSTSLNRTAGRLLGCEDEDMYHRLLALGARGLYLPNLIIHHFVPQERLTKRYFRKWCFWRGVSRGLMDRQRPAPVVYLAGVPRYLYGRAARGLLHIVRVAGRTAVTPAAVFVHELAMWDLAGFAYGKHLYRVPQPRPTESASAKSAHSTAA